MLFPLSFLLLGFLVFCFSCKDETYTYRKDQSGGVPYDPALPVEVTEFIPEKGKRYIQTRLSYMKAQMKEELDPSYSRTAHSSYSKRS